MTTFKRSARWPRAHSWIASFILLGAVTSPGAMPAAAQQVGTLTVSTMVDDVAVNGNCSLREAIVAATTRTAHDGCPAGTTENVIVLPSGTLLLSEPDALDINGSMTIRGSSENNTVIKGASNRVLHIGQGATVVLDHLTITDGSIVGDSGGGLVNEGDLRIVDSTIRDNTAEGDGGGIANLGTLHLVRSRLMGNEAKCTSNAFWCLGGRGGALANSGNVDIVDSSISDNTASHSGGGIYNNAALAISASTISGNRTVGSKETVEVGEATHHVFAGFGAGVANDTFGTLTIVNSTISGNTGAAESPESNGGGIANQGELSLAHATISDNSAGVPARVESQYPAAASGGGIFNAGSVKIATSILSGNRAQVGGQDCAGPMLSAGFNVIHDVGGCSWSSTRGDALGAEPGLGALQDNGGLTATQAPRTGSVALGGVKDASACLPVDQRGVERARADTCDIGAYQH